MMFSSGPVWPEAEVAAGLPELGVEEAAGLPQEEVVEEEVVVVPAGLPLGVEEEGSRPFGLV